MLRTRSLFPHVRTKSQRIYRYGHFRPYSKSRSPNCDCPVISSHLNYDPRCNNRDFGKVGSMRGLAAPALQCFRCGSSRIGDGSSAGPACWSPRYRGCEVRLSLFAISWQILITSRRNVLTLTFSWRARFASERPRATFVRDQSYNNCRSVCSGSSLIQFQHCSIRSMAAACGSRR